MFFFRSTKKRSPKRNCLRFHKVPTRCLSTDKLEKHVCFLFPNAMPFSLKFMYVHTYTQKLLMTSAFRNYRDKRVYRQSPLHNYVCSLILRIKLFYLLACFFFCKKHCFVPPLSKWKVYKWFLYIRRKWASNGLDHALCLKIWIFGSPRLCR